jgi:hypothetical protein
MGDMETNASLGDGMQDRDGPAMTVRWTTLGAAVVREPMILEASTVSLWVTGRQMEA